MLSIAASILAALWGSSVGRPAIIAGGLFLAGFGVGFFKGYGFADPSGAADRARQASDQHWQREMGKANADAEDKIRDAIRAGESVGRARDRRDLERLCNGPGADPDCRQEDVQQLPRVR